MKITSNIENSNYTQWITGFVESVINQADLKCDEVIIDELDAKLLKTTVSAIRVYSDKSIAIRLKNNQIIGRSEPQ